MCDQAEDRSEKLQKQMFSFHNHWITAFKIIIGKVGAVSLLLCAFVFVVVFICICICKSWWPHRSVQGARQESRGGFQPSSKSWHWLQILEIGADFLEILLKIGGGWFRFRRKTTLSCILHFTAQRFGWSPAVPSWWGGCDFSPERAQAFPKMCVKIHSVCHSYTSARCLLVVQCLPECTIAFESLYFLYSKKVSCVNHRAGKGAKWPLGREGSDHSGTTLQWWFYNTVVLCSLTGINIGSIFFIN